MKNTFTPKEGITVESINQRKTEVFGLENPTEPTPNALSESAPTTQQLSAYIYFAYDDIIWGLAPDGSNASLGCWS